MLPPAKRVPAKLNVKEKPKREVRPYDPSLPVAPKKVSPVRPTVPFSLHFIADKDIGGDKTVSKEFLIFGDMCVATNGNLENLAALKVKVDVHGADNPVFVYWKDTTVKWFVNTMRVSAGMQAVHVLQLLKLHARLPPKVSTEVRMTYSANRRVLEIMFRVAPIIRGRVGAVSYLKLQCVRA
jgi:hypothetical protein